MTDFSIPITGLAANDPVPGSYLEVEFAQGEAATGTGSRAILLLGNRTTAGSATVNTVIYGPDTATQLLTQADAIALFGDGSELSRMFKRATDVTTDIPIYAVAVTESAGTAASFTLTYVNAATANATARVWVGDEFTDASITSGDSITTIALAVRDAINARTDWPVTASASLGVVTCTAKLKGPRGNWIRYSGAILGSGVATTVAPTAPTFATAGATADTNATALTTILPFKYYYIASAAEDATQLGALVTQVNTQAAPTTGIRQRVFAGSVDSLANATTIATGVNAARCELLHLAQGDIVPAEMAAQFAAVCAVEEAATIPKLNFDGYGNADAERAKWRIKAPRSGAAPTRTQLKSALNNGITPVGVNQNGSTYLVMRCTTKSLNGATNDYRIRDSHKVTVCDFYGDDLKTKTALQFAGKSVGNDPVSGQRPPGANVATPRVLLAAINKLTDEYGAKDLLQSVDQIKAETVSIRESSPSTRLTARVPLRPIDVLHQIGIKISQVA